MNRQSSKNSNFSGSKPSSRAKNENTNEFYGDKQTSSNAKLREQLQADVKSMKSGTSNFGQAPSTRGK